MENKNHEDIIMAKKDIAHIKETTDRIECVVSELLKSQTDNAKQFVEMRGRIRALEHDVINLRALVWKIVGAIITGGGAYGIFEAFGK